MKEFRKNCQIYHNNIKKLLKKGNIKQANKILNQIQLSIRQWEKHIKESKFKINLLKAIYSNLVIEKSSLDVIDQSTEADENE